MVPQQLRRGFPQGGRPLRGLPTLGIKGRRALWAPRIASSVSGALSCTLRLSPPPSPRTPPEGGHQRPTRTGAYASSVRRGRGRDRGMVRGRDRVPRTAHTHAPHCHTHAPHCRFTHTRARATLPLHRCRPAAACPLPRRCCAAPPLRRCCRGAASAAPLPRRCPAAAATVLPRGGSLHSNPPAKGLVPPGKAASSLPLRVVLAQSALVFDTRCASVFFYAREISISVFSNLLHVRRRCRHGVPALVHVTRCASVFFYAREILISVFSTLLPVRRRCRRGVPAHRRTTRPPYPSPTRSTHPPNATPSALPPLPP